MLLPCVPYGLLSFSFFFFFLGNSKCHFFVGSNLFSVSAFKIFFISYMFYAVFGMMRLNVHFIYSDYSFQRTQVPSTLEESPR